MEKKISMDVIIPVYNGCRELAVLIPEIKEWIRTYNNIVVYIVDDGSTDPVRTFFEQLHLPERVVLVEHKYNQGRGAACNSGANAGENDAVVFIDVDCMPDEGWIGHFQVALSRGYDGVFGNIQALGNSFWSRYSNCIYHSRATRCDSNALVLSTQFCAFKREVFERSGKYFSGYRQYGFEDRDILSGILSSQKNVSLKFLEDVYVVHHMTDSLSDLEGKMIKAGRYTAPLYAERYPDDYRQTQYWWFDRRQHGRFYNGLISLLNLPYTWLRFKGEFWLEKECIPFKLRKCLGGYFMAVSFYNGTKK